jgi:hypothetical protein
MVKTILTMLATYSVATAVLFGGASVLGVMPQSGIDGADGKNGADGIDGADGKNGVDASLSVYVLTYQGSARKYSRPFVNCKSGDTAISGGASVNGESYLVGSYPSGNGWVGEGMSVSGGSLTVYVVCQDNP